MLDYYLDLDDGTGADRGKSVRLVNHPCEGQIVMVDGRDWIVERVEPDRCFAYCRPSFERLA